MNLRCSFCQTPYAIGRAETIAALQHIEAENLTHYDAHCPRCRRATPVLRQKLEQTLPNWREALHELEQQAGVSPASASQLESAPAPKAESTPEPVYAKHHRSRAGSKARDAALAAAKAATAASSSKKKKASSTAKKKSA